MVEILDSLKGRGQKVEPGLVNEDKPKLGQFSVEILDSSKGTGLRGGLGTKKN